MIYFSDVFGVEQDVLDAHGAFNIALVNDLPLFVDPLLLFDSGRPELRELHDSIIEYLVFVKDWAQADELTKGPSRSGCSFAKLSRTGSGSAARGTAVWALEGTSLKPWPGISSACSAISAKRL